MPLPRPKRQSDVASLFCPPSPGATSPRAQPGTHQRLLRAAVKALGGGGKVIRYFILVYTPGCSFGRLLDERQSHMLLEKNEDIHASSRLAGLGRQLGHGLT